MYYVPKKSLIQVDRGENGNLISTNELGNQTEITEDDFYANYEPVRKIRKTRTNIDDAAKAYMEMGELVKESNENNEDYIFDTKMKVDKAV